MIDFDDLDSAEAVDEDVSSCSKEEPASAGAAPTALASTAATAADRVASVQARCAWERERPPIFKPGPRGRSRRRRQPGVFYGLPFPWSPGSIKALGPAWLTEAFHAARTLPQACEVVAIRGSRSLGCQGAVRHILLELDYSGPNLQNLHRDLLVRLPYLGATATEITADHFVEINFYRLYEADAPMSMPMFYFGDVSSETENFILITEWIPVSVKCLDLQETQLCTIRGFHGAHLAGNASEGTVFMSNKRKEWELWTIRPVDRGFKHTIQTHGGSYFTTTGEEEQDMALSQQPAKWTIIPVEGGTGARDAGTSDQFYLQGPHQTHLASLKDGDQTLYMSPNRKDWEKWRLLPIEQLELGPSSCARHLDLKTSGYDTFHSLIKGIGRLAALGTDSHVQASLQPADGSLLESDSSSVLISDTAAWADSEFLEQAAAAQDFLCLTGDFLCPDCTLNKLIMQRFRAVLVTARANREHLRTFLQHVFEGHLMLGLDYIDADSAFTRFEDGKGMEGLRCWQSLQMAPAGWLLWRLLSCARPDIMSRHKEDLMQTFVATVHKHGGPPIKSEDVMITFLTSAILECLDLLRVVHEFHKFCTREEWASMTSLQHPSLCARSTPWGSLWLCLRRFASLVTVLEQHDTKAFLHTILPYAFISYAVGSERIQAMQASRDGGDLRAGAGEDNLLIARLPRLCWVIIPLYPTLVEREGIEWVQTKYPIPNSWVPRDLLVPQPVGAGFVARMQGNDPSGKQEFDDPDDEAGYFHMSLLAFLFSIRRQYTGVHSGGMAEISVNMLQTRYELYQRATLDGQQMHAQRVHGSFLVQHQRRSWWPVGYEDWAHHAFLMFSNGSIADITADQFLPELPQICWPADNSRYTMDFRKADAANRFRRDNFGLENWTRLCEEDAATDGKAAGYPWWTVEWHTTMQLPPQGGTLLRHNAPVELPPVTRRVELGDGRPAVAFRRLTAEHELEVWLLEGLFESSEAENLVRCCEARQGFQQSLTKSATGEVAVDGRRTSSTCPILWPHLCEGVLEEMREVWGGTRADEELQAADSAANVCAKVLDIEVERIEPLQLVKYAPGQRYLPHLDAHEGAERRSSFCGEQRLQTLLVFLSDVPEADGGGHLHFPLLGLRILPRVGCAVLWSNVKRGGCQPDPNSLHEGVAPMSSGKVAMNVWIVDRPLSAASVASGRHRSCGSQSHAASQRATLPGQLACT